MKYIFDFDDVLFYTTRKRTEFLFPLLVQYGVSKSAAESYYAEARRSGFSMQGLIRHFSLPENFYKEVMSQDSKFVNSDLMKAVENTGKANCYILTFGEEAFQREKIKSAGIEQWFREIITVPVDEKNDVLAQLCARHSGENLVFIDDKEKHLANMNKARCPNLKGVRFTNTAQLRDDLPDLFRRK
jgi:FMN phosphatase YigB (HAD superfamily)